MLACRHAATHGDRAAEWSVGTGAASQVCSQVPDAEATTVYGVQPPPQWSPHCRSLSCLVVLHPACMGPSAVQDSLCKGCATPYTERRPVTGAASAALSPLSLLMQAELREAGQHARQHPGAAADGHAGRPGHGQSHACHAAIGLDAPDAAGPNPNARAAAKRQGMTPPFVSIQ